MFPSFSYFVYLFIYIYFFKTSFVARRTIELSLDRVLRSGKTLSSIHHFPSGKAKQILRRYDCCLFMYALSVVSPDFYFPGRQNQQTASTIQNGDFIFFFFFQEEIHGERQRLTIWRRFAHRGETRWRKMHGKMRQVWLTTTFLRKGFVCQQFYNGLIVTGYEQT